MTTADGLANGADGKPFCASWAGQAAGLYRPALWRKAGDIGPVRLRQILAWPLILRPVTMAEDGTSVAAATARAIAAIEGFSLPDETGKPRKIWREIRDLLDHASPRDPSAQNPNMEAEERSRSHAEFVYFHDYVQSVLFRQPAEQGDDAPIRIFTRDDVAKFELRFRSGEEQPLYAAAVERLNLCVFSSGAVVLVVELVLTGSQTLQGQRDLTLAEAQSFIDVARRVYSPFFAPYGPGKTPAESGFRDRDGRLVLADGGLGLKDAPLHLPDSLDDLLSADGGGFIRRADSAGQRSAPVFAAWRGLLAPLQIAGYEAADEPAKGCVGPICRHVIDERIPALTHLSLTGVAGLPMTKGNDDSPDSRAARRADLYRVSRGDWIRLCYADEAGEDAYPYSPGFHESFEADACYDRFWPSEATDSASRIMFAGYHVCIVGAGEYFDRHLTAHARRHYFQMMLMCQVELASLLSVSSRISAAVQRSRTLRKAQGQSGGAEQDSREAFQRDMLAIQNDFLEFVHLFRFTGLSNQIQAQEVFTRMRASMRLDALFEDVRAELSTATGYLLGVDAQSQSRAATSLSFIAAIGLVFSIALAFVSMNLFIDGETIKRLTYGIEAAGDKPAIEAGRATLAALWSNRAPFGLHLAMFGLSFCVIGSAGALLLRKLFGRHDPTARSMRKLLFGLSGLGGLGLGAGLAAAGFSAAGLASGAVALLVVWLLAWHFGWREGPGHHG
jgi:hypothetical protein